MPDNFEEKQRMEMLGIKKGGEVEKEGKQNEKEKTTICSKCNKEVPMGNFCNNCGSKLEKIEEGEKTTICPYCNKEVPIGKFCRSCGSKLEKIEESSKDDFENAPAKVYKQDKYKVGDAGGSITDKFFALTNPAYLTEKIKEVKTRDDLINFLDTIPGIDGDKKFFASNELKQLIKDILDKGDVNRLDSITRSAGLREKVAKIMYQEKKDGINKM